MSDIGDDRTRKVCPDCAESVLAAARKCLFCGYRFDVAVRGDSSGRGVLGILRPPSQPRTIAGYLAQTGVELGNTEQPVAMCLGRIDEIDGFVEITTTRIFVMTLELRHRGAFPVLGYSLSHVVHVDVVRRFRKSTVRITWLDESSIAVSKLRMRDLRTLRSVLMFESP